LRLGFGKIDGRAVMQEGMNTWRSRRGYLRATRGLELPPEVVSRSAIHQGLRTEVIGQNVIYLPVTTSTMDVAKEATRKGAAEGTIVLADEQTAGRGRLGRRWLSPPGVSVLLSMILEPNLAQLSRLNMVVAMATARSIEKVTGLRPVIKWPNDIIIEGKNVSGALIESDVQGDEVRSVVVGIGVNVNLEPSLFPDITATATSLRAVLGKEVSRLEVLRALLVEFDRYYRALRRGEPVFDEWRRRLITLGQEVRVRMGDVVEEGYAEGVDEEGRLILQRDDGSLVHIVAGDVTLRA